MQIQISENPQTLGGNSRLVLDLESCQNHTVPFFLADDSQRTLWNPIFSPVRAFAQDSLSGYGNNWVVSLWPSNDGDVNGAQMVV